MGLEITFAKVDLESNPELKNRFNIKTYPRILLWDNSRSYNEPVVKRYFKKFGLTAQRLLQWVAIQIRLPLPPGPSCQLSEHTCDAGGCINVTRVCDGSNQCSDGTDETYCSQNTVGSSEEPVIRDPAGNQQGTDGEIWVYDAPVDSNENWDENYVATVTSTISSIVTNIRTTTADSSDAWSELAPKAGKVLFFFVLLFDLEIFWLFDLFIRLSLSANLSVSIFLFLCNLTPTQTIF